MFSSYFASRIFFWKIHEMSRKAWVVAKKLLINGFRYLYHLHSCGFKLKGEQRYLRDTLVKLASWFRTPVMLTLTGLCYPSIQGNIYVLLLYILLNYVLTDFLYLSVCGQC